VRPPATILPMPPPFFPLLLTAALAATAAGQTPPTEPPQQPPRAAWTPLAYLRERLADLMDIAELNVALGRGAKLELKYGLQFLGLGRVRSRRFGTLDRRAGAWREIDSELGLLPLSLLAAPVREAARLARRDQLAQDAAFVLDAGSRGVQHLDRKELNADPEFLLKDTVEGPLHTRWGDCFPIGGELHAGIGIRLILRPLQAVDFLIGFAGLELDPWLASQRKW